MRRRIYRSLGTGLLAAAVVATGSPVALASEVDWEAPIKAIPTTRYSQDARSLVTAAASAPGAAGDSLGAARAEDLGAHPSTAFLDGVRITGPDEGRAFYQDLQQFTSWSSSRLKQSATSERSLALTRSLTAARMVADSAIQDAASALEAPAGAIGGTATSEQEDQLAGGVEAGSDLVGTVTVDPSTRTAALNDLTKARQMLGIADDADTKALAVTAAVHDALAWRYAYGVLAQLGITYTGDRDADGVVDLVEFRTGSSPLAKDTDGDGLDDKHELDMLGWVSPRNADSDGDGVPDGQEDLDQDGLGNLAEVRFGSSPTEPDTDHDGLGDRAEQAAGTSPVKTDSDADTLLDGVEGKLGTSPTIADTDGDGVRDDKETLTADVKGPDGITARITGTGDFVTGFRAVKATGAIANQQGLGQVAPAYDFEVSDSARAGFAQAQLVMPYDPAALPGSASPSDLRVFWYDPAENLWRPAAADQRVDTTAHTVTATVNHFSRYAIFDIKNWGEAWSAETDPCHRRSGGGTDVVLLDLSLILDSSGSMAWNDPNGLRRTAAKSFVDALLPEDRAAVVDFDYWAYVRQGLTTDKAAVKQAIDQIDDWGGTDIAAGVSAGTDLLINNGDPDRARMAILLTDGEGYYDPSLTDLAKANGITIYTVGLGPSVDAALLESIATGTGGTYHAVASADELPDVFRRLSEETGDDPETKVDTDQDGLDDCTEKKGALGTTGERYITDPTLPDTDGDGIKDGDEVGLTVAWDDIPKPGLNDFKAPTTYTVYSDPTKEDTDGDGVDDGREGDLDLQPRWTDSDFDGLADGVEVDDLVTNPLSRNSDGDEWDDAYEVSHASDGLDPQRPDTTMGKWTYVSHFLKGYVCGDFCQEDTIPWLTGYLAASATSFVPVVGWVVGAVTDLRDMIANAIHGDWIGSGVSLLGVVPYVGDVGAIAGKVTKFVGRVPRHFDDVVRLIAQWDKINDTIKTGVLKAMLLGKHGDLTAAGLSDETIILIAKSERSDLRALAAAARSPMRRVGSAIPFQSGAKAGESALRSLLGDTTTKAQRQIGRNLLLTPRSYREYDALEDMGGGLRRGHEAKVGAPKYGNEVSQCERDGALLRDPRAKLGAVQWHFIGHSRYGSLSISPELLSCLERNGISFVLHAA